MFTFSAQFSTLEDLQAFLGRTSPPTAGVPSTVVVAVTPTAPAAPSPAPTATPAAPLLPAPPTAPAAVAPSVPVAPSSPVAGVEVDARGLPWDARIHSETRAKTQEGVWRKKRGTQETYVAEVEAALRQAMAATAPIGVDSPSVGAPDSEDPIAVFGAPPLAAPVALAPVAPAPVAPVAPAISFGDLMIRITPAMTGQRLTVAKLAEVLRRFGLPDLQGLIVRPDLVPRFASDPEIAPHIAPAAAVAA